MKWYFAAFKKYAVLSGRAARREFWYFLLCNLIVWIFLAAVDWMAGGFRDEGYPELFTELYGLVTVIPILAVSVRRLHDSELSGWWVLIGFVPLVGGLVLLWLMALEGTPGSNRYGAKPTESGL